MELTDGALLCRAGSQHALACKDHLPYSLKPTKNLELWLVTNSWNNTQVSIGCLIKLEAQLMNVWSTIAPYELHHHSSRVLPSHKRPLWKWMKLISYPSHRGMEPGVFHVCALTTKEPAECRGFPVPWCAWHKRLDFLSFIQTPKSTPHMCAHPSWCYLGHVNAFTSSQASNTFPAILFGPATHHLPSYQPPPCRGQILRLFPNAPNSNAELSFVILPVKISIINQFNDPSPCLCIGLKITQFHILSQHLTPGLPPSRTELRHSPISHPSAHVPPCFSK